MQQPSTIWLRCCTPKGNLQRLRFCTEEHCASSRATLERMIRWVPLFPKHRWQSAEVLSIWKLSNGHRVGGSSYCVL